jgi:hypothetical protein
MQGMAMDEKLREQINKERAAGIASIKRLEQRVEECERALKVLHTWAGVENALVPEHVRELTAKALRMTPNTELTGRAEGEGPR